MALAEMCEEPFSNLRYTLRSYLDTGDSIKLTLLTASDGALIRQ
jgi:hypothetical protein